MTRPVRLTRRGEWLSAVLVVAVVLIGLPWLGTAIGTWWTGQP